MKRFALALLLGTMTVAVTGCPPIEPPPNGGDQVQYDQGFEDGFIEDAWYWDGYYDGYDMADFTPIYYDASEIQYVENPPYDAGYWDGVWYAYNDGYFVDYHYAFILGFSEGYDNAFWPDYLSFLESDGHTEFEHGGWVDGYNDGFSEGRVFGANDYEQGLDFDWLDALYDYEAGTDLYFDEVDVGTGVYGPVVLYEYGVDPTEGAKSLRIRAAFAKRSIRRSEKDAELEERELFRPLPTQAQQELGVTPKQSLRSDRELALTSTWLERIEAYRSAKTAQQTPVERRQRAKDKAE